MKPRAENLVQKIVLNAFTDQEWDTLERNPEVRERFSHLEKPEEIEQVIAFSLDQLDEAQMRGVVLHNQ